MRGAVARAGVVCVEEVDDPVPASGQVLVAPVACGICGSDLHLVEAQAAAPDLIPPIVLGHEFVAEVLDYGHGTERRFAPGTLVTSVPYLDSSTGPQLIGLSPVTPGALAERTVLQASRLLPVRRTLTPRPRQSQSRSPWAFMPWEPLRCIQAMCRWWSVVAPLGCQSSPPSELAGAVR